MGVPVFYLEAPEKTNYLSADDSFHAHKVLRLKIGDPIQILNGNGKKFNAVIALSDSRKTEFRQLELDSEQSTNPNILKLWIAPTKQMERMEWMIEKCTEIGIDTIGFFVSKNSERKEIKLQRLEKIVVSAIKQSKQLYLPKLREIITLKKLVEELGQEKEGVGFAYISKEPIDSISTLIETHKIRNVIIGPEGDFTQEEVETFFKAGFKPFSLGNSILRTETAGIKTTVAFSLNN